MVLPIKVPDKVQLELVTMRCETLEVALAAAEARVNDLETELREIKLGMGDDFGDSIPAVVKALKAENAKLREALQRIVDETSNEMDEVIAKEALGQFSRENSND